jgi:hypothetical protein
LPRIRAAAITAAAAVTLGLVTWAAGGAQAGETPGPVVTPTVSPNFGYHPKPVRSRDWTFDVQQSDIAGLSVDDVEGAGAIPMNRWADVQLSNNVDRFQLGGRSVTLWHDGLDLAALTVNRYTCTVTFDQPDGRFRILNTTGLGAQLRSRNGQFDLEGLISFPLVSKHRDGGLSVCPLSFLSDGRILRLILAGYGLPAPTFTDFAVQGRASVFALPVRPVPYPTKTYAVPTDTATA